ncbi:MAG: ABC transporter substrate-binding protein [Rhodospirillaceae bacterium]|nr:ABC transporter substrate-binding protein [Rhodospirillaceae bacterium]
MTRIALSLLIALSINSVAYGDTLSIVTASLPETRGNPFSYSGLPAGLVTQAAFEPLVKIDDTGNVAPELAESWTQESPLRWVFKLRQNVKFSNGEGFDAEAVVVAFKYLMGSPLPPDALSTQVLRERVANVSMIDAHTIAFETKAPDPILPIHMISLRVPAPKAWSKGFESFLAAPAGTGPYRIDAWTANTVTLSRNTLSRRPGKLETIKITEIPDQTARGMALLSKTADIAMDIPNDIAPDLNQSNMRLQSRAASMVMFFQFVTTAKSPVQDVRVRRALNYAVNKQAIINAFLADAVKPATQFTSDEAFGYNADLAAYPYDPDKARSLLAEAGFKAGFTLPALYVGGNGADRALYQQVAADLAHVGVKMSLREITLTTWMQHLFSGDWPVQAFVTGVQGWDPLLAFNTRSCNWVKPHYCDRDVLPLLDAARTAPDAESMRVRTKAVLTYERDNPPGILLWRKASFDGLSDRVVGYSAVLDRVQFTELSVR